MIVIASVLVLVLVVWSLVLTRFEGVASSWLWTLAGVLLGSTTLAWIAVLVGLSGSIWALFNHEGDARTRMVVAGLGMASLSGVGVLLLCLPVLIFLISQTWALVKRREAAR